MDVEGNTFLNGGVGVEERDPMLFSGIPPDELLAALKAFLQSGATTPPQAEVALRSTGLERFVDSAEKLTRISEFLVANAPAVVTWIDVPSRGAGG